MQQATPPLLSLKVRRTVDTILALDTPAQKDEPIISVPSAAKPNTTATKQNVVDHSGEIARIMDILEKQSFAFVAYKNKIHDAKIKQDKLMSDFHQKATIMENKLSRLQTNLLKKVSDLNKRVDTISKNLALKPTFISMLPQNTYGRITGISSLDNIMLVTTADGYLLQIDKKQLSIEKVHRYSQQEALFQPTIYTHGSLIVAFCLSSHRTLIHGLPDGIYTPEKVINTPVESYAINYDPNTRDVFEVALGEANQIEYASYNQNAVPKLNIVGSTKKIRGNVTALLADQFQNAIFAITSRRMYYSISATNFNVIFQESFDKPVMQLAATQCFILLSVAPNDIVILEKNREKFHKLYTITIEAGLRRFFAASNELLVIMKDQRVQRRRLCDISVGETICEQEAADYNGEEYIGCIYEVDREVYLSHGNRISYWS